VSISIYDVTGRLIRSLVKEHRAAGEWSVQWHGENDRGQGVASGVYFYRSGGEFVETKKMMLLK
jgi:flagellar hook assembly protein FlgD